MWNRFSPGRDGSMRRKTSGPSLAGTLVSAVVVLLVSSGCEGLLDVDGNPDEVGGEAVEGAGAFQARFIGAQSDFAVAFGDAVDWGGLFTDEMVWGGSTQDRNDANRRDVTSDNIFIGNELWTPIQIAAKSTSDLLGDIEEGVFPTQVPDGVDSETFARLSVLAGYTRTLLADLFCTTVFDASGPELSQEETYARAEQFFSRAIDAAGATSRTRDYARVGRARVRLMLGDEAGALSDAQQVTEDFEFLVEYADLAARTENQIFGSTWDSRRFSIDPVFRDVTIDDTGTPDPRVEVFDTGGLSFNGTVRQFNPVKYSDRGAPIRIASWFEAQYIIAEIQGGDVARDIINEIRSRQGIGVVYDEDESDSDSEILEKLLEERSRTLFLEGHRMPDLRRFREEFGIDRFPTAPDFGDQVCMPLPDIERDNNPDI